MTEPEPAAPKTDHLTIPFNNSISSGTLWVTPPSNPWLQVGELRIPLKRPGWVRRMIVRLLLGWRWQV